jgi:hypothetical protein
MIPVIGTIKSFIELSTGEDMLTGQRISQGQAAFNVLASSLPVASMGVKAWASTATPLGTLGMPLSGGAGAFRPAANPWTGVKATNSAPALRLADDVATLKSIRRYSERLVRGKVTSSNASTMLEVRNIQAAIANKNYRMAGTGFHSLNFKMASDAKSRGFLSNLSIDRSLATPAGILPSRRPDYLFGGGGIYDIKPFRATAGAYDNTSQFLDIRDQTGIMPVPLYYSLW